MDSGWGRHPIDKLLSSGQEGAIKGARHRIPDFPVEWGAIWSCLEFPNHLTEIHGDSMTVANRRNLIGTCRPPTQCNVDVL